jgi:hypothetical protein
VPCTAAHSCGTAGTADSSHIVLQRSGPASFRSDFDHQHEHLPSRVPFSFPMLSDYRINRSRRSPDARRAPRCPSPVASIRIPKHLTTTIPRDIPNLDM